MTELARNVIVVYEIGVSVGDNGVSGEPRAKKIVSEGGFQMNERGLLWVRAQL